jgi:hypothetical protein
MNIVAHSISRVRDSFSADLKNLGPSGVCYLPEWICSAMSEAALNAGWQVFFYNVLKPDSAEIPLQADLSDLDFKLKQCVGLKAVLLAHPLGYQDPGIGKWIDLNVNKKMNVFLDLAQSYGRITFEDEIKNVASTYCSFNGRKLIRDGGGVLFKVNSSNTSMKNSLYMDSFRIAAEKQILDMAMSLRKLSLMIGNTEFTELQQAQWGMNILRSNYYRTVLKKSELSNNDLNLILSSGYAQPVHTSPNQNFYKQSDNYKLWVDETILIFPEYREDWQK